MTTDAAVLAAAAEYTDTPIGEGWGKDAHLIRVSEADAFAAGVAWILGHPADYERLTAAWNTHKPWHDPKPGDVWALTVIGEAPFRFDGEYFRPANDNSTAALKPTSPIITAGERIWPKETT